MFLSSKFGDSRTFPPSERPLGEWRPRIRITDIERGGREEKKREKALLFFPHTIPRICYIAGDENNYLSHIAFIHARKLLYARIEENLTPLSNLF